jgi:probable HAF family extracellular repeat protein
VHDDQTNLCGQSFLVISASVAQAITYTITDLGTLGGAINYGGDIEQNGQIVGDSTTSTEGFNLDAYFVEDEPDDGSIPALKNLNVPIGNISAAVDINVGGWVVGYTFGPMPETGFVWKDGQSVSFLEGLPENSDGITNAGGINNRNQIVGFAHDQDCRQQAVLWETGSAPKALGTLGGRSSAANAINDSGQVVGEAGTANFSGNRAFLWQEGTGMQDLGALAEGRSSEASGINDWGAVVGTATDSEGQGLAVLWNGRKMRDLNSKIDPNSDWLLTWAHDINNSGQILASGYLGSDDSQRAVLLTPVAPVPLPAVVWLMLLGLTSLGWLKHRRAAACWGSGRPRGLIPADSHPCVSARADAPKRQC